MNKCIYTYAPLNSNTPQDDLTETLEHIVPYALGGSNSFSLKNCSKKENNELGKRVDAPFLALLIVGMLRHKYGIQSYSKTVPDIRLPATCVELNKPCSVIFEYGGEVKIDFGIDVGGGLDEGRFSISGGEDRVKQVFEGVLKKAMKRGMEVKSQALTPLKTFSDALAVSSIEKGISYNINLDLNRENFYIPWTRAILKMCLGLGAKCLGEGWEFSQSSDRFRRALIDGTDIDDSLGIRGDTMCRLPPEISNLIACESGKHTLAVLPHEKNMIAVISLFGGETFDAIVDLGSEQCSVNVSNDNIPRDWVCCYQIDPISRTVRTRTISEVQARMP